MKIPDPLERPVLSVPEAGELLGLGRSGAFVAASRGEIPGLLTFGRRKVVATATLLRALGLMTGDDESATANGSGPDLALVVEGNGAPKGSGTTTKTSSDATTKKACRGPS